jgi:subtilase family serine protease
MKLKIFLLLNLFNIASRLCDDDGGSLTLIKLKNSFGHKNYIEELTNAPLTAPNLDPEMTLTLTLVTGSMANTIFVADYYSSLKGEYDSRLFKIISQTSLHVKMSSKVKHISQVFNTSFLNYKCPNKYCYASTSEIYIPLHLNETILGVLGLEEVLSLKTNYALGKKIFDKEKKSSPIRQLSTSYNYFLGPDVAQVYNFPNSDGAGIRVGIISLGGYFNQSDLDSYFSDNSLGASAPKIGISFVNGAQFDYVDVNDDSIENYLDIEIVSSVTPKANITLYYGPNTVSNFYDVLNLAMQHSDVVSISWGTNESRVSASYRNSFNALFNTYSSVPVFAATGDDGSTGGVGFPASCTNAIGIFLSFKKILLTSSILKSTIV